MSTVEELFQALGLEPKDIIRIILETRDDGSQEIADLNAEARIDLREQRDWLRAEMLRREMAEREEGIRVEQAYDSRIMSLVDMFTGAIPVIMTAFAAKANPFAFRDEDPPLVDPNDFYIDPDADADHDHSEATITPEPPERIGPNDELLIEGMNSLGQLVSLWNTNWGVEGAPQPARDAALLAAWTGHGRAIAVYVRENGGLVGAVQDRILGLSIGDPATALALAKTYATEIVALGTAAFALPLDELLEVSMFKDPEGPLSGGLAGDSINFARPAFRPQMSPD